MIQKIRKTIKKIFISKTQNEEIIMGFWKDLPQGFKVLAPMADVTDSAFRHMIAKYSRIGEPGGGPDLLYTEFVAADGLFSDEGRANLLSMLDFDTTKRPIVAQIFSADPQKMEYAARLCKELGFDGIDLNMGCPERNICRQGAGSAMIKTPEQAKKVILAAKRGAGDLPVSVKTRIGWSKNEIETWIPQLLSCNIAAIILHGRTRAEMSKVPAHWDIIARAAEMVKASGKATKFIGNGDVTSLKQADEYIKKYHLDGIMIGRALFGKPWFFDASLEDEQPALRKRLEIMLDHTKVFLEKLPHKNFNIMKKHYKAYVSGFNGAKELRIKLMEAERYEDIEREVKHFLKEYEDSLE